MDKAAGRAVEVAGAALGWAAAPGVEEDRVEAVKVAAAGEDLAEVARAEEDPAEGGDIPGFILIAKFTLYPYPNQANIVNLFKIAFPFYKSIFEI